MGWGDTLTHRQFLVWREWAFMEKNRPSKDNYYAMQIAMEIRNFLNSFQTHPPWLNLDQFKVQFRVISQDKEVKATELELEGSSRYWAAYLKMVNAQPAKGTPAQISEEEIEYWEKLFAGKK